MPLLFSDRIRSSREGFLRRGVATFIVISLPLLLEGRLTRIILNCCKMHAAPTYTPTLQISGTYNVGGGGDASHLSIPAGGRVEVRSVRFGDEEQRRTDPVVLLRQPSPRWRPCFAKAPLCIACVDTELASILSV